MRQALFLFVTILLLSESSYSEYRAFRLLISKKTPQQQPAQSPADLNQNTTTATEPPTAETPQPENTGREVISTLDPYQYRGYYSVRDDETIVYTQTWMCPGRTSDYKEICPAPETRLPAENTIPAASSSPP